MVEIERLMTNLFLVIFIKASMKALLISPAESVRSIKVGWGGIDLLLLCIYN